MTKQQTIQKIARDKLGIQTLEERKRDSLDFHELSVALIAAALEAAYDAGRAENDPPGVAETKLK